MSMEVPEDRAEGLNNLFGQGFERRAIWCVVISYINNYLTTLSKKLR